MMYTFNTKRLRRIRRALALACVSSVGLTAAAGCESDNDRMTADMGATSSQSKRDLGAQNRTYPAVHDAAWDVRRVDSTSYGDSDGGELLVTVPGPNGEDLLAISRHQAGRVLAGQKFKYEVEVENISGTPLHDIELTEWHSGQFQFEGATPAGSWRETGQSWSHDRSSQGGAWSNDWRRDTTRTNRTSTDSSADRKDQRNKSAKASSSESTDSARHGHPDLDPEYDRIHTDGEKRDLGAQHKTYPPLLKGEGHRYGDSADRAANRSGRNHGKSSNDGGSRGSNNNRNQWSSNTAEYNARRWHIDHLAPGQSETIEVTGMAVEPGEFRTCMTVSYEPAVCFVTQVVQPDLKLVRTIDQRRAYVCQDVDMHYSVKNVGSGVARNVRLVEDLPDGLTLTDGNDRIAQDLGNIGPGETVEGTVTLTANSTGRYTTRSKVTNGTLEASTPKDQILFQRPELNVMVDAPKREYVGRDVPVHITVENVSDIAAVDTVVNVKDIDQLNRVSLSTQRAELDGDTIRIGRIEPGESRDMTMTFHADEPGNQTIAVAANAYCAQAVRDQVAVNLSGVEAVRLEMIDLVDPVVVGDETVYKIRVKNQGTADSINVGVTATLPDEMSFVSGEGDSRVTARGKTVRLAPIARLGAGEEATWRIRAKANQAAKTQLQLKLTTDASPRAVNEQESTTIIAEPIHSIEEHDEANRSNNRSNRGSSN